MDRVLCWLPLMLAMFILRRANAVPDQCSELQGEVDGVRKLNRRNEMLVDECYKKLKKETCVSERAVRSLKLLEDEFKSKLQQSDGVINNLNKQLEVLRSKNEDQKQLQATIDDLTKTVESLNQTVQLLCGKPNDACRDLLEAVRSGDVNTVKILFKCTKHNCTTDDEYRNTPLIYAAGYGRHEVVRVLLEGGGNMERGNAYQQTALHGAAFFGHVDVCSLLLDRGAKVDPQNEWKETPLHDAAGKGYLSIVKLLVERGADVALKNNDGLTASDQARGRGHNDVADWLDSACRDLLEAAKSGDVNTVKILFKCTKDNCRTDDAFRDTPLIFAAINGHVEVVRVLLEGGVNLDGVNAYGETALYFAAFKGHLEVCRLLLDWGAKVDTPTKGAHTPMHSAARKGHLSVVKLLAERGADVRVKNNLDETPSDVARKLGYNDVAVWLDKKS